MPLPISDYALIGDCETAALVGRDGSIDWLCLPRFDSGACFAALLGGPENGRWRIAPADGRQAVRRRYRGDTLVLETDFETEEGAVTVVDFMPIRERASHSDLARIVVGRKGRVRMRMDLTWRFDYGRIVPWVTSQPATNRLRAVAGPHAIYLETPVSCRGVGLATEAEFDVEDGDRVPFVMVYEASHLPSPELNPAEVALEETEAVWTDWAAQCHYDGDWPEAVTRSLITVKALTYRPTGGIVAAPTTSLPEAIGGERNWDYRFCWIRDATFTLLSLINAGYRREAEQWCDWLLRAVAGAARQIQPLYGIAGEHRADEVELDWLSGYRDSAPVRIGNGAFRQLQLDVFGSVIDTLHEARVFGLQLHEASNSLICELLKYLETVWQEPDEGIWEVRSGRQHFVHSKLMCWVAFDRGVEMAEKFALPGPVDRWRRIRDQIHAEICARGYSERRGAFVQAYGSQALDAVALLIPIYGFLPATDPRVASTVAAVERHLMRDGFVLRYDTEESDDGLTGDEGAFLACSFWLADCYVMQGRKDEARHLFERLLGVCNDVGLLSEQWDWRSQSFVGNFPQAFSHFALIDTAYNLWQERGTTREGQRRGRH